MSNEQLLALSIAELAVLYRAKEVSPVDVTRAALDRIERMEPQLNAYILITRDRALADARKAEAKLLRGEADSPLCGVPIALKDIFDVEGLPMTCGSNVLKGRYISTITAHIAKQLFAADSVLLGKNNLLEFAYGVVHPDFGPTGNPWDLARSPMGSSTGSAVTVAARQAFAAMGTDTGGSIRLPASYTGIVGLKPTYGIVSKHGLGLLSVSCDHVGPLTRTAEDAAIMMNVIAGYDPKDPTSARQPTPDYVRALQQGIKGLRVGVVAHELEAPFHPEMKQAVLAAADVLRGLGAEIVEVSVPGVAEAIDPLLTLIATEASAVHKRWLAERTDGYSGLTLERLQAGARITAVDYIHAKEQQRVFRETVSNVLEQVDVLLSPGALQAAHLLADEAAGTELGPVVRPTGPYDLSGHPAVVIPGGFNEIGLPLGVQLIGRMFADHTILRVAHHFQQATDFHRRLPNLIA